MDNSEPTVPYGYCQCGCGRRTKPYRNTNATYGHVAGEPAKYLSGHGGIRPLLERFSERVDKRGPDDCWEWTAGRIPEGYGRITHRRKRYDAHRLAWEIANGRPVPEGMEVCHRCDNPPCCNPAHLFVGTTLDNALDRERKGRGLTGRSPNAKLTADSVREIRRLAGSVPQAELACRYGVATSTVNDVVKKRSWRGI